MELDILYAIQSIHNVFLDKLMIFVSTIGNAGIIWIILGIVLCFFKKSRRTGFMVLVSLLVGFIIGNLILKNVIARPRPCWVDTSVNMLIAIPKDYSFPSGHTLSSFTAATAVFLNNKKFGIPLIILAAIIGFSRMYLFVHYFTDVLAGAAIGILVAYLVKLIFDKFYIVK